LESHKKNIYVVGLNHDTAPLDIRGRVAFDNSGLVTAYQHLKASTGIGEAVILSTCNRTELYFCWPEPSAVVNWMSEFKGVSLEVLRAHLYVISNSDVLSHAAAVASGIKSMVLGETQIFGQMKAAYHYSEESNFVGRIIRKVFQSAFSLAKQVRTDTEIGKHSISTAAVSLKAVDRIFSDESKLSVLFVGAGEMIDLFGQHFSTRKFNRITFANRTSKRALELANKYGGDSINLADIGGILEAYDIVVSCTSSLVPIMGKGAFERALHIRKHRPMAVFDLAVPCDVEQGVGSLDDIFLFTIDDLGELVREGIGVRKAAVEAANKIILRGVRNFDDWTESDGLVQIVKMFRGHGSKIVEYELDKALLALRRGENPEQVLRNLSNALEQKFLDRPSRVLNKSRGDQRRLLSEALVRLFDLDS